MVRLRRRTVPGLGRMYGISVRPFEKKPCPLWFFVVSGAGTCWKNAIKHHEFGAIPLTLGSSAWFFYFKTSYKHGHLQCLSCIIITIIIISSISTPCQIQHGYKK